MVETLNNVMTTYRGHCYINLIGVTGQIFAFIVRIIVSIKSKIVVKAKDSVVDGVFNFGVFDYFKQCL